MKKLKLRKWVKYLILAILNSIVIINLPSILRTTDTVNNYRFNILVIATIIFINSIYIYKIEVK